MSIERNTPIILQHDASPFTTMFNDVLQGIKNTAALGVYCYLASKPPGWEIRRNELQRHFNCGEKHIKSCISYLKKLGVVSVISIRDTKGRIVKWSWELKRHIPANPDGASRSTITHHVDNPPGGKVPPLINKRNIEIKDNNKNTNIQEASPLADVVEDNPFEIPTELIEEWKNNRGKKKPVTKIVWRHTNKVLLQLRERGILPIDAFERMVACHWINIQVSYFEKDFKTKKPEVDLYSTEWINQIDQGWVK